MQCKVILRRDKGALRQPHGHQQHATGALQYVNHQPEPGYRTPTLCVLGTDWRLYQPMLKEVFAGRIVFLGYERDESAWHLQEWECWPV